MSEVPARRCSKCGHNGHNSRTCISMQQNSAREGGLSQSGISGPGPPRSEQPAERDEEHDSDFSGTTRDSRKKGVAWSEEEHRQFLLGLQKIGKGDWRGISRQFVQTRSPTQVASHAQKYFIRQSVSGKRKRRSSLFDLVPEGPAAGKSRLAGPNPQQNGQATTTVTAKSEPPALPLAGLPQGGPEAYAMACLYQNMMMQQGSMAWLQAMCGQQQQQNGSQYPPPDQGYAMNPMQAAGFPFMAGGQDQGIAQMTPQQQAQAMLMLAQQQQQQQQLAAACAMGSMQPFNPSIGGAGAPGAAENFAGPSYREGQAEQGEREERESFSAHAPKRRVPSTADGQHGGSRHTESWGTRGGEPPPERFGNGVLIRPKAQKAYPPPPHEAGALPSYMTATRPASTLPTTSSLSDFTQREQPEALQPLSAFPTESCFTGSGGSSGTLFRGVTPPGGSEASRKRSPASNEQRSD